MECMCAQTQFILSSEKNCRVRSQNPCKLQGEKSPLPEAQRRIEPATLHHTGQQAQHTTNWAIVAPRRAADIETASLFPWPRHAADLIIGRLLVATLTGVWWFRVSAGTVGSVVITVIAGLVLNMSVWQYVQLSELIDPWETWAYCWLLRSQRTNIIVHTPNPYILRVPDQSSVSQAWYIVEIHHSGRKPSIFNIPLYSFYVNPFSPMWFVGIQTSLTFKQLNTPREHYSEWMQICRVEGEIGQNVLQCMLSIASHSRAECVLKSSLLSWLMIRCATSGL